MMSHHNSNGSQVLGATHSHVGDWNKLKLKQANNKNTKKKKETPTKDAPKREGLHDYLEIWPMQKHAILNNNINILSTEL
jgi:hypothetical protein